MKQVSATPFARGNQPQVNILVSLFLHQDDFFFLVLCSQDFRRERKLTVSHFVPSFKSGIPRNEIFVTTKLTEDDQGYESTLAACDLSLKKLGLDYIGNIRMKN